MIGITRGQTVRDDDADSGERCSSPREMRQRVQLCLPRVTLLLQMTLHAQQLNNSRKHRHAASRRARQAERVSDGQSRVSGGLPQPSYVAFASSLSTVSRLTAACRQRSNADGA